MRLPSSSRTIRSFLVALALVGASPVLAQPFSATQVLPSGQIDRSGGVKFGSLTFGRLESGKFILTPDAIRIGGTGSSGAIDGMTVSGTAMSSIVTDLYASRIAMGANNLTSRPYTGLPSFITFANTDAKAYLYSYRTENQESLLGTAAIVRNTPGSGYFGPARADFALLVSSKKDNWDTATGSGAKEGEIDPLIVTGAQGKKGDIAGVLIDIIKRRDALSSVGADENGGAMAVEIAVKLAGADGQEYHRFHVLPGFIEGPTGLSKGKGYGYFALSKIGYPYAAYAASIQPIGGVDQFGNIAPPNGWDNLIVNDATGAVDGSGVNYRVDSTGRTFSGFPSKQVVSGYDAANDLYKLTDETGANMMVVGRTTKVVTAVRGVQIAFGSVTTFLRAASGTVSIPSLGGFGISELGSVTVPGAAMGDLVTVAITSPSAGYSGFRMVGAVTAANTVALRVQNLNTGTAGGFDGNYTLKVERFE